jgi:hypothetical protein
MVDIDCPRCKARTVQGRLNKAEQVGAILILQIVLPLIPLGFEQLYKGAISDAGVILTAATFAMATARSSQRLGILIAGLVAGGAFSIAYGAATYGSAQTPSLVLTAAKGVILLSALVAAIERIIRHGIEGERALVYRGGT